MTAAGRPSLKKFPAGLRLAGSQLHPKPKSQEATRASQHCELQIPQSLARALPRPPLASLVSGPRVPPIGLSVLSVTWEY